MTGIDGHVKMRDGERISNLSVFVVQRGSTVVEVMRYDTENMVLNVDYALLDNVIWPGNATRMPARGTAYFQRMYIHIA